MLKIALDVATRVPAATRAVCKQLQPLLSHQEKIMAERLTQSISSISGRLAKRIIEGLPEDDDSVAEDEPDPAPQG